MLRFILNLVILGVALGSPTPLQPYDLNGRIVGGKDTTIQEHPYQLSLIHNYFQHCAGVMLSPDWALTVAHCVAAYSADVETVGAGSSYANKGAEIRHISQITIHPLYNETTIDYDIALLRLVTPITTPNASAAVLPEENLQIVEGSTAIITGWGRLSGENRTYPDILQMVEVPVISQEDCQDAYPEYTITDRMFCAGVLGVGGKDACDGDSGGPVVIDGVLSGLISWGLGCAEPDHPGVFTNVLNLRSWIKEVSGL